MTPLLGFAPDADPTRPGVITDCTNFVPFIAGMRAAEGESTDIADIPANARSAASFDGNTIYAGTASGLYSVVIANNGNTDLSAGGGYSLGSTDLWSFVKFRSSYLAATPTEVIQKLATDFADISGAPQAKILEIAAGFVVAFNTSTATDQWYCCAQYDETDWVISVSTQCTSGRLDGAPGAITAAKRLGDDIVAFKETALFVGRYVGAPAVWQWTRVSELIGCAGQNAVAETPLGLVFVGKNDIYLFDGTTPRPISGPIREWFFADMNNGSEYQTTVLWDESKSLVWIHYKRQGVSGELNGRIAWHPGTDRWGVAHVSASAACQVPFATSINSSTAWFGYNAASAVDLKYGSGAAAAASMTTGDYGADSVSTACNNLRVRYTQAPASSSVTGYTKESADGALTTRATSSVSDGRHNMRQTGRWHRFKIDTGDTGTPCEVVAVEPELIPAGRR